MSYEDRDITLYFDKLLRRYSSKQRPFPNKENHEMTFDTFF